MTNKTAVVCGAGGFIGTHLVNRLKADGYWVRGVDLKLPLYSESSADEFHVTDLRDRLKCQRALTLPSGKPVDEVYQLAADMGGAMFIFTGDNDFNIMHNSGQINLNIASLHSMYNKIFYSSSACVYNYENLLDKLHPSFTEAHALPAHPDAAYGWEKLFSEYLYLSLHKNLGKEVRVARFHNTFGPLGTWTGGREKAPAALCRKVAETEDGGVVKIFGDGKVMRSFIYIDETVEGIRRMMEGDFSGPLNIGTDELVTMNQVLNMICKIAGKTFNVEHIPGPLGPLGRNSENTLIKEKLNWAPSGKIIDGLKILYPWVLSQVNKIKSKQAVIDSKIAEHIKQSTNQLNHAK
jgi:GDP-D-mannose 3',5'-epimerase